MQMRPEIQIASMMKAMRDVVIPALAGSNKMAIEQAQLVLGMLNLMSHQLPMQFRFDREELSHLVEKTAALRSLPVCEGGVREAIADLAVRGKEAAALLEHCRRDPSDLKDAVRSLRACIVKVVKALAVTDDTQNQLLAEKIILDLSRDQLLRDRSLLKPQGWEPDPAAVPDIAQLLA
jgi:hypothetical protein